jgi:hypothetical protein
LNDFFDWERYLESDLDGPPPEDYGVIGDGLQSAFDLVDDADISSGAFKSLDMNGVDQVYATLAQYYDCEAHTSIEPV